MEDFPRFPPEANPLDPQFADPRLLARQQLPAHNHHQRVAVGGGDGGGRRRIVGRRVNRQNRHEGGAMVDAEGNIDEDLLLEELGRLQDLGIDLTAEELVAQIRHFGHVNAGQPMQPGLPVDLESPLMQLFLQTLLPWYHVDPVEPPNPPN